MAKVFEKGALEARNPWLPPAAFSDGGRNFSGIARNTPKSAAADPHAPAVPDQSTEADSGEERDCCAGSNKAAMNNKTANKYVITESLPTSPMHENVRNPQMYWSQVPDNLQVRVLLGEDGRHGSAAGRSHPLAGWVHHKLQVESLFAHAQIEVKNRRSDEQDRRDDDT